MITKGKQTKELISMVPQVVEAVINGTKVSWHIDIDMHQLEKLVIFLKYQINILSLFYLYNSWLIHIQNIAFFYIYGGKFARWFIEDILIKRIKKIQRNLIKILINCKKEKSYDLICYLISYEIESYDYDYFCREP